VRNSLASKPRFAPDDAAFAIKYANSLKYRHFLVVLPVKRQQAMCS
jgi:hypothetical protein